MTNSQMLQRPEGRLAYEVTGAGPLVVCVPGLGEIRQSYRLLVPVLLAAGYRVATMDIRGHGDSDGTFGAYDDVALAGDILALIDELGQPAFVVGNSMAAGAGVIASVREPDRIRGLVLLGPFVRNPGGALQRAMFRLLMARPWGPAAFLSYYPKWLPGTRPDDYEQHTAQVRANVRKNWRAVARTSRTSHQPAADVLGRVGVPVSVVMGGDDVDWKDPAAEAAWIGEQLHAEVTVLPGVGHYPQAQAPEPTAAAVRRLVERVTGA